MMAKPAGYPVWPANSPETHRPGRDYRAVADAHAPPQFVMGFGTVGERAIEQGIAAVADLLS